MQITKDFLTLYAVTDRAWTQEQSLADQVEQGILGGVSCVQIREKHADVEEFTKIAKEVQQVTQRHDIPLIINDSLDIFRQIDAQGIHIGQGDLPCALVRQTIGANKILGVSVHNVEQALEAQAAGADYLGVGAIFVTSSKDDADHVSIEMLNATVDAVDIPIVAIGGINQQNIDELKGSGIAGVAVISAIFAQQNIYDAAKVLKDKILTF